MPKMFNRPLWCMRHNSKDVHRYNIVNGFVQSRSPMSALEVLQTFPTQRKCLISTLGTIYLANSHLLVFDLDKDIPQLASIVSFHILVLVQKINIHHCIFNEGASTCIMSKSIWKKLGFPKLKPSNNTLREYDGPPYAPVRFHHSVPVQLVRKIVLFDIEVPEAQLDYNILMGQSCMYKML